MPRRLPQRARHELRSVDLAVTGRALLRAHEVDERAEQLPALRVPEHGADGFVLEVKEVHLLAELAMVAALGLFEAIEIGLQLLGIGPRRAVDALQHLVPRIAAPIGAGELHELEARAEPPRRRQVRAAAQIDERALAVQRDRLAGRDSADDLGFVALALLQEELDGRVAIPDLAHDLLVARHDLVHALLDALEILGRERLAAREIVVEAVLDRGADRHLRFRIELLDGFRHDVRRVVAQELEPVRGRARHDLDARVVLDRQRQVLERAVYSDRHGVALEARADAARDGPAVDGRGIRALRSVGERDGRHNESAWTKKRASKARGSAIVR